MPSLAARREGAAIQFSLSGATVSRALLMRTDGTWRQFLFPVQVGAEGHMPLPNPPPEAGRYRLFVEATGPDGSIDTFSQEIEL